MNTQLLCLFTTKEELDKSVNFILGSYKLTNPNVFILESKLRPEEAFITFNVEKGSYTLLTPLTKLLNLKRVDNWTILTLSIGRSSEIVY